MAGRGRPCGPREGPAVPGADNVAAATGQERLRRLREKPATTAGQDRLRVLEEGPSAAVVDTVGGEKDGVAETGLEQMPVTCV